MANTTKNALGNSLKNVLKQKPLDKVTITDITNDCGVNRMTFYYHFQDIYDLIEWVCVSDAERALAGKMKYSNWQEGMADLFQLMLDNKSFVMNVYHSVSREHLDRYVHRLTEAVFMDVINELSSELPLRDEDKEFIADFYKYAIIGIVYHWLDNRMKTEPEYIISRLAILIEGDLKGAVARFSEAAE